MGNNMVDLKDLKQGDCFLVPNFVSKQIDEFMMISPIEDKIGNIFIAVDKYGLVWEEDDLPQTVEEVRKEDLKDEN